MSYYERRSGCKSGSGLPYRMLPDSSIGLAPQVIRKGKCGAVMFPVRPCKKHNSVSGGFLSSDNGGSANHVGILLSIELAADPNSETIVLE